MLFETAWGRAEYRARTKTCHTETVQLNLYCYTPNFQSDLSCLFTMSVVFLVQL